MLQTTRKPNRIMLTDPNSPASEMYRTLRFNIESIAVESKIKTIAITSANQGEGKTTTAANLAIAFAQTGRRVILLDANLRNPAIHLSFSTDKVPNVGLTDILLTKCGTEESIRQSEVDNLFILNSGDVPSNPSDLLSSKGMNSLLVELKRDFDFVLIDTSAMLKLSDTKIIMSKCDGVLLVVDQSKVKKAEAHEVKEELNRLKVNLLGIAMNRMD